MDKQLAREAGKLYALPETDYTKARNARAKELRSADPELAAAVAKLPKPSRPLATINHLAHEDPSEIRALIQSGKRLRKLQEDAVRGTSQPSGFAAASAEFREALERVQRQARARGLTDALLVRVASTLRAAALDPELQPLLERGVLAEEPDPAGFAFDPSLVPRANACAGQEAEGRQREAEARPTTCQATPRRTRTKPSKRSPDPAPLSKQPNTPLRRQPKRSKQQKPSSSSSSNRTNGLGHHHFGQTHFDKPSQ